jgi:hypothetical protein
MLNEYQTSIHDEIVETISVIDSLLDVAPDKITMQIVGMVTDTLDMGIDYLEVCLQGYNQCGGKDKSLIEVYQALVEKLDQLRSTQELQAKLQIVRDMRAIAVGVNLTKLKEESQAA